MMTTSGRSRAAASNRRRTAQAVSSGWVALAGAAERGAEAALDPLSPRSPSWSTISASGRRCPRRSSRTSPSPRSPPPAAATASLASRDLPMPAGPGDCDESRAARSRSARASAPASCASSASRPTNAVSGGRASRPAGMSSSRSRHASTAAASLELDGAERLRPHPGAREAARVVPEQHLAVGGEPFRPAAT